SVGVVVGVLAVALTEVLWLDPVIAIAVALNIAREGYRLVRQSTDGLLDRALPDDELAAVHQTLSRFTSAEVHIDGIRTRRAGHAAFMTATVTVPGQWSVARAHDLADEIEAALREALPHLTPVLHLEPASRHA
ncbi:MAG TPA: cation transporter dimerization domain-containing protein, partial [Myxococcota bacterium]|nr:cation transporter dimerization domain-containing protein [Myxococcota bacterium]